MEQDAKEKALLQKKRILVLEQELAMLQASRTTMPSDEE
jgi:hypothetical protein